MSTTSSSGILVLPPQEAIPTPSHAPDTAENPQYPTENGSVAKDPDPSDDGPSSYFSLENLKVAQVNIIGGTINGYAIGFVAVYSQLYKTSTNCALFKSADGCNNLINAECQWNPAVGATEAYCGWATGTCSKIYSGADDATRDMCLGDERCTWYYSDSLCGNLIGYTSSNNGIFAGSMIMGCLIGSYFAGNLAQRMGNCLTFLVVGLMSIVCAIMIHVSADSNEFWVLCVGRLVLGLMMGLLNVACPMYVGRYAHETYKNMIGVLFQVFTGFGVLLAALVGLALGYSINPDKDPNMLGRMEGFIVVNTFLGILVLYLSAAIGYEEDKLNAEAEKIADASDEPAPPQDDPNQYGWGQMAGPLVGALLLAGTMQLTGINAVMNFAPTIMVNLGLEALSGNAIVMSWNFCWTLASIPLSQFFTQRQIFLTASFAASCACLFLCGVPVYPGVTKEKSAKNGVAIFGMAVFIAAYEAGIGPCFFVLAQELFPQSFRPKGLSLTLMVQFIFNLIINVCYPIATERISGGPSGNQDKGQSIAFMFFGGIGFLCFIGQIFFIFPFEEKEAAQNDVDALSLSESDEIGNQQPLP